MIQVGQWNRLRVERMKEAGAYLNDGAGGILLPRRFVPRGTQPGDELTVFVYHDSEDRPVATTQQPRAVVGDIALLQVVGTSRHGAFLHWGLMKDLLVPKKQAARTHAPGRMVFGTCAVSYTHLTLPTIYSV